MTDTNPTSLDATDQDHGQELLDARVQVESFRQVREARKQELLEDYTELISDLIADTGKARQMDIAQRLGVAQPTVAKMIKRLIAVGLVEARPYGSITLTAAGNAL